MSYIATLVTSKFGRLAIILLWLSVPIFLTLISPSLTEVSSNVQQDFLPTNAESTKAIKVQEKHFPSSGIPGLLVYNRANGLTQTDIANIKKDFEWLQQRTYEPGLIGEVKSAVNYPMMNDAFTSPDNSVSLVNFTIRSGAAVPVEQIQEEIGLIRQTIVEPRKNGLNVWLTGPAGVFVDAVTVFKSIDFRIAVTSVILVLAILFAIYRSPIMAILPILSAGFAYLLASSIVAMLADQTDLKVNSQATAIMVVLIFGAGTDYMLFISARYKELLRNTQDHRSAIANTMTKVGPPILSSALTTIVAMTTLSLASLGSFQTLGPILALGMCFAILSGTTFIPAVLSTLGRAAYWPRKVPFIDSRDVVLPNNTGIWYRIGIFVSKYPVATILVSVIILLAMSLGTLTMKRSFDLLSSLPSDSESVVGYNTMKASFPPGMISPTSVYVTFTDSATNNLEHIDSITSTILGVDGVTTVTSPSRPFGDKLPITFDEFRGSLPPVKPTNNGITLPEQPFSGSSRVNMEDNDIMLLEAGIKTASMISPSGNVSRLEVIFSENPGSSETLDKIGLLRKALIPHHGGTVQEILVGGDMAIQYDTKVAINRDMLVISPVVLAVILVVLIILVKAIIAPIYLLLSVVLTFFASLGISVLIFQNVLGHEGIGGNVPIFMFIFLVALGIDYNIYIISRVREEAKTRDTKYGTIVALSQTGGVITSAGIILAGTFTAMATLPLTFLFQLGFVVAFGVLLDTFFIRGIVVPAFVILFGRWNWWPSMPHLPRSGESTLEN